MYVALIVHALSFFVIWTFVISMIYLYSLLFQYNLSYAYIDLCLSMHNWLITFHKSISDLEIDPSWATVKLFSAPFVFQLDTLLSLLGDLRDPRVHKTGSGVCFSSGTHNYFLSFN